MKKHLKILISTILIAATVLGCALYLGDYYRADGNALLEFTESADETIEIEMLDDMIVTKADAPRAGLIFYPGGKVEYISYLPLMLRLAEHGITSVLVKMPFNLAVLDVNAADGIREEHPEITHWYIGGHSLGGSMAASYLEKNPDICGIVLLGSYSTADLSGSRALSIYGSEDGVMNREKYEKYRTNLPTDLTEIVIEGGNHAYFGIYGEQKGDGEATISNIEQINITADHISEFIK